MKPVLPLLFVALAMTFSCQQPEDSIRPILDKQVSETKTCHLTASAIVEYREAGHDGSDPFYYLAVLDASGNWKEDVYTDKVQHDKYQVGEKITIVFHYRIDNSFSYVSACGSSEDPTMEQMTEVVVCDIDGHS